MAWPRVHHGCHDVEVVIDDVADELYGLSPERFTEVRNARAKEIGTSGDRELASQVRKLPKPTVAAWLANALVRTEATKIEELIALGPEFRGVLGRGARTDVRRVAERRREVINELVEAASHRASEAGHSMGTQVQRQLEETLEAAVADDQSAAVLRAGRLSGPLTFIGFGESNDSARNGPRSPRAGKSKTASSRNDGSDATREVVERAVTQAAEALSSAERARQMAKESVDNARRRDKEASARFHAATNELRDADREKAEANKELAVAIRAASEAEQRLKEAEREHRSRQAKLGSVSKRGL
jgi:hypothetical protein